MRAYTDEVKPWLIYSLARLGVFVVALVGLLLLGIEPWIAAVIAAVAGLCIAYIFLGRLRDPVARDLAERRSRPRATKDSDAATEDLESDARF
jgi:hypothetical protein